MKSTESQKLRIKNKDNVHSNHRSRVKQKFVDGGFSNFAEHEILELLLYYAIPQQDTNPLSHRLINRFENLKGVFDASIENLLTIDGVGENTAILIKLIPALMQEYGKGVCNGLSTISNHKIAKEFCSNLYIGSSCEQFNVICINPLNKVTSYKELSSGSASRVMVSIRDITDYCLRNNCDRIIISHNHPQSNATPSNDDLLMTRRIFNSCVLNEIDVLDHIIVSPTDSYSLAEKGLMQQIKMDVMHSMGINPKSQKYEKFATSTLNYLAETNVE